MGASTWIYFTPHHPKPSAALRQLREHVFTTGQYRKPATVQERLKILGPLPLPSQLHRQRAEALRRSLEGRPSAEIEEAIGQAERLADDAAKREPQYLRYMEALKAGTLDSLPETMAWNASMQEAFGPPPKAPKKGGATPSSKMGSVSAQIAMILMHAGEQGTHSILDILRIGKKAAHAAATALSEQSLLEVFGTTKPVREQVEAGEHKFAEDLHWQAVYFAVYDGGSPTQWAFVGSSGD